MASPQPQTLVVPGQLLGEAKKFLPGPGTHLHEHNIYASLLGTVTSSSLPHKKSVGPAKRLTRITPLAPASTPSSLPTISVQRSASAASAGDTRREVLPEVGNTVLCRVLRINPRQATVAILVVGESVLEAEWQGIIRAQDVRATEKDRVKIGESFRPGDVVRAQVISIGDQASYYLSTASNELGVIMATSEAGNAMHPVNWKECRDPETGESEPRKVAKPF